MLVNPFWVEADIWREDFSCERPFAALSMTAEACYPNSTAGAPPTRRCFAALSMTAEGSRMKFV